MNNKLQNSKPHNFITASLPLICLMSMMCISVQIFGEDASHGPNQIVLFICTIIATIIGLAKGFDYIDIEKNIVSGISKGLGAALILLFIGSLIGVWLLSGTVPALIYYGVQIINPHWFYASAVIVCALVSVSIGSSWSTCATIGVAFIGIGASLGLPPALTAGAIISGAYFGDKLSPLSETTNLAAAVGEVNLFSHIKNMLWTTIPAIIIAALIFTVIGFTQIPDNQLELVSTNQLLSDIENYYHISIINLIPLIVLIALTLMRVPVLIVIFISTVIGALIALFYQDATIATTFVHDNTITQNLVSIWTACYDGITVHTNNENLNELLSGGGMNGMLNTVYLFIAALSFGSAMEATGSIKYLIEFFLKFTSTVGRLISTTILSSVFFNVVTGDQYMAIIMPGRMYQSHFKKLNLNGLALSRSIEDGGTITSVLVPWNTCAVFVSGVIGVSTLEYLPYCFFNIVGPIIGILFGIFNIKVVKNTNEATAITKMS